MGQKLVNFVPCIAFIHAKLLRFVWSKRKEKSNKVRSPSLFLTFFRLWVQHIFLLNQSPFKLPVEILSLFVSKSLHYMMEIIGWFESIINVIISMCIQHVQESSRNLSWYKLSWRPFKLANVFQFIKMEIIKRSLFHCHPYILIMHFSFESQI